MNAYLRPTSLDKALAALADGAWTVVAGGTDYYPARVGRALRGHVLDISALPHAREIVETDQEYRIGPLTTWSDVRRADLPSWFDGLKMAAREVGGVQIQNAGTVCGNICNASPAADGIPVLLALDAVVDLASQRGARSVPLAEFVTGNRQTVCRCDELVTGIRLPKPAHPAGATFLKLGARAYLVISIVMVAGVLECAPDGTVAAARIAVGACSPVARRLPALETALAGLPVSPALASVPQGSHHEVLAPIDDVRADAAYRREAALILTRRALAALGGAVS